MGSIELSLIAVTAVSVAVMLGMTVITTRAGLALSRAKTDRDRAVMAEAATMRVLRMSVADLRADTMRLLGFAEAEQPLFCKFPRGVSFGSIAQASMVR